MRAMILAAGRGERMRPLTDHLPKPLLSVGGQPLIVWHLRRLAAAGIQDIVINHAWLGDRIVERLGDGSRYNVRISYSAEESALETAGGIAQALPLLGDAPFLVMNGDIWCDWNPAEAFEQANTLQKKDNLAWMLLVDNPKQHPLGDFVLTPDGKVAAEGGPKLTFAGIGVYHPSLFTGLIPGVPVRLAPLLVDAMGQQRVQGKHHKGDWTDVGTPERLAALDADLTRPGT